MTTPIPITGLTEADIIAAAKRMSELAQIAASSASSEKAVAVIGKLADALASNKSTQTPTPVGTALAADTPRVRMCPECRVEKCQNCTQVSFDANDNEVPCPCLRCHAAPPMFCTSCGKPQNPETGECAGCSD